MIEALSLEKSFGDRKLFGPLNFRVQAGERWALVGANGSGKTTLLRILAGEEAPDGGIVAGKKDATVGYLPQEANVEEATPLTAFVEDVAEEVQAIRRELRQIELALAEHPDDPPLLDRYGTLQSRFEQLGGYRLHAEARRILTGLGFRDDELHKPVRTFSGGWRMRALLARILLRGPDLILLDEPTNHLDIVSLEWIEEFIRTSKAAFLIVSHDIRFLDRLVGGILALEPGDAVRVKGNYATYVAERDERRRLQQAAYERQQRKIASEERFIERFRAKNTKAKAVQSRVKRLEKEERIEAVRTETRRPTLRSPQPQRSAKEVAVLTEVEAGYGDKTVYRSLDFSLQRGERVALIGPNGAGKSTLIKLLTGAVAPRGGTLRFGAGVSVSYFSQFQLELLNPRNSVLEEILRLPGYRTEGEARSLLGALLFSGDDVEKKVAVLSGGEKSRLALARILTAPGNLLLMDEPTNHLDLEACEVVKEALARFEGTLAVITHDRDLINRVATRVVYVDGGRCESFPGNYDDYLRMKEIVQPLPTDASLSEPAEHGVSGKPVKGKEARRAEAERRETFRKRTAPLRDKVQALEAKIEHEERRLAQVEALLLDPGVYGDPVRSGALGKERAEVSQALERLGAQWEEAAGELETLEQALRREAQG